MLGVDSLVIYVGVFLNCHSIHLCLFLCQVQCPLAFIKDF
jgi:hypothetical protein